MRRGDQRPEDLERPEGNDLLTNYGKHDVGEAEFIRRVQRMGLSVEEWGIDMRHDDGEDGIIYDDAMDFKVFDGDNLVAMVDVKTKSKASWMGRFNLRHYEDYYEHAQGTSVPVFVIMMHVDTSGDSKIYDEFVFEIGNNGKYTDVHTSEGSDAVSNFPDGNGAVLVKHEHRRPWRYFEERVSRE